MNSLEKQVFAELSGTVNVTSEQIQNFTNNSSEKTISEKVLEIKPVMDGVLLFAVILIMICMGIKIQKDQLLYHLKKPIGISIGMFSQFVILPLCAFILLQCVNVSGLQATGVLIMACCPGGPISNVFALLCDGDLSLSVTMTSLSNLFIMGVMPLNLWIYGRSFETDDLVVPYVKLAISLVCVISPVILGIILRWKIPRIEIAICKICGIISGVILLLYLVFQTIVFPSIFYKIPVKLYPVMISLPFLGFSLSYLLALVFRQNPAVRKTIAVECGVQNISTGLAVIILSFPSEQQNDLNVFPYLYSFSVLIGISLYCCLYQIYKRCTRQPTTVIKLDVQDRIGDEDLQVIKENEPMFEPN